MAMEDRQHRPETAVRIAALGDIMLARDVGRHYVNKPDDFKLEEIAGILGQYDLVIANLENPVGIKGAPHPKQDPHVAFRCHPDTLAVLKNLNVDVVSLGNNHLLDYGEETLFESLHYLEKANIAHVGGGKDYAQANKPACFSIRGMKIALLSSVMIYSASTERAAAKKPGVADYRIAPLLANIRALKRKGYTVLVTVHWGLEYCFYPVPYQRLQARRMIDAGASLILGHGPHYPQGIEDYQQGQIVHSLGNFIFDEPHYYSNKSFVYGAELDGSGRMLSKSIYPVNIINHIPVLDERFDRSRTAVLVSNLDKIYQRKDKKFWKGINNRLFRDIVMRVTTMKSWKFVLLPPPTFYFTIGVKNLLEKVKINNALQLLHVQRRRDKPDNKPELDVTVP
jgi:poly-gamma-glutamate capsule biosynthesis protein CapA/YwtB (metallophosphatase superfamily)